MSNIQAFTVYQAIPLLSLGPHNHHGGPQDSQVIAMVEARAVCGWRMSGMFQVACRNQRRLLEDVMPEL